jgi:glycosyltransferase involved in cell wall biosynthesis
MNDNKLHVGVYLAPTVPQSFRVYAANIQKHFPGSGIEVIPFKDARSLPRHADVLWDIRSGGGNPPLEFMLGGPPLVITVHGFAPISLSGWDYFKTLRGAIMAKRWAREKHEAWLRLKDGVRALIAVSEFSRGEAIRFTGMDASRIVVCHHGVEYEHFSPAVDGKKERYFLHISNNEPRKNLDRIVRAFRSMDPKGGVELLLKLPQDQTRQYEGIPGIRIVAGMISTGELAELYRRALGFIFPSLYEGFGMPILEAMASGCPVLTSTATACPEVADNAALLVDPKDHKALAWAMSTLASNEKERERLSAAGLERVKHFDWQTSARCHAHVLRQVAQTAY